VPKLLQVMCCNDQGSACLFNDRPSVSVVPHACPLQTLADPRQSMASMVKAREELVAKLGSKTPLGDYIRVCVCGCVGGWAAGTGHGGGGGALMCVLWRAQVLSRRSSSLFATQETLTGLIDTARDLLEVRCTPYHTHFRDLRGDSRWPVCIE
jgi:hypothetical protein